MLAKAKDLQKLKENSPLQLRNYLVSKGSSKFKQLEKYN
jgi:hypothetical protein